MKRPIKVKGLRQKPDGSWTVTDSTPKPLKQGKHKKASRLEKAWKAKSKTLL